MNNPVAAAPAAADSNEPKSVWRRRLVRYGLPMAVLAFIGLAALPYMASPFVESTAEEALRSALGATGEVDGLSIRWFGGVDVGAGRFERPDASLELSWRSIRSDVSVTDALPGSRLKAGTELIVDGLRCVIRQRAVGDEDPEAPRIDAPGATAPETVEHLLRLPSIRLTDAEIHWYGRDQEIHLKSVQLHSGAPVNVALGSKLAAGLGLEEAAHPTLTLVAEHRKGDERWAGAVDLASTLGPGNQSDRLSGSLVLRLEGLEGQVPARVRDDGTSTRAIRLHPSALEVEVDAKDLIPKNLAKRSEAGWPLDPNALLGLTSSFSLQLAGLEYGDLRVEDVLSSGSLRDARLEFAVERSRINDGSVTARATLDREAWQTAWDANEILTTREVIDGLSYISPIFAMARSSPAPLDCRVGFTANLSGTTDLLNPLSRLSGDGDLRTSEASFAVPAEFAPLVALLSEKDQRHLRLAPFRQPFEIRDGKILNRGFEVTTREAAALVEGFTTTDGTLAHEILLDRAVAGALGKNAGKDWARVTEALAQHPIRLEGTVRAPRVVMPELLRADKLVPSLIDAGLDLLDPRKGTDDAPKPSPEEAIDGAIERGLDSLLKKKKKRD